MTQIKLRFWLLIFILPITASAQDTLQTIELPSVNDAIRFAKKKNPDLEIYRIQQEIARREFRKSKNYILPHVSAGFSAQNNMNLPVTPLPGEIFGQPGETIDAQFGQDFAYNTGITTSKNVLDWQVKTASKMANINRIMAVVQTELYQQQLTEQVAVYYYSTLVTREALAVAEEDANLADSLVQLSQEKLEQGLIDQFAVNKALINANTIQQQIAANQLFLEQCENGLKQLFGLNPSDQIYFSEPFTNPIIAPDLQPELTPDISLKLAEHEAQNAKFQLRYEQFSFLPRFSVSHYYGLQQYRDSRGFSLESGSWSDYSYVLFNLSIPVFQGFSRNNSVKAAKLQREIADKKVAQKTRNAALNDQLLVSSYQKSATTAHAALQNFHLAEENKNIAFQRYQEGLISLEDYLLIFDDYLNAESVYLNALADFYNYYATIISRS